MLGWLYSVIVGSFCRHKWVNIEKNGLTDNFNVIGVVYTQQCEHCGKIKFTKFKNMGS